MTGNWLYRLRKVRRDFDAAEENTNKDIRLSLHLCFKLKITYRLSETFNYKRGVVAQRLVEEFCVAILRWTGEFEAHRLGQLMPPCSSIYEFMRNCPVVYKPMSCNHALELQSWPGKSTQLGKRSFCSLKLVEIFVASLELDSAPILVQELGYNSVCFALLP